MSLTRAARRQRLEPMTDYGGLPRILTTLVSGVRDLGAAVPPSALRSTSAGVNVRACVQAGWRTRASSAFRPLSQKSWH